MKCDLRPITFSKNFWTLFLILFFLFSCNSPDSKQTTPATSEDVSEEEEASPSYDLNQLGDSLRSLGEYSNALSYYQISLDTALATADSFGYYDTRLDIACVYDRMEELPKSIAMGEEVVEAYIRSGDSARLGRGYSTLAAFYLRADMEEKGRNAAQKGFDILKSQGPLITRCAAYNQMAFTFSERGEWAAALPLLDTAFQLMQASGVLDQISGMYLNLGNCYRNLQRWPEAENYFQKAAANADSLGLTHISAGAYLRLSQVAESTGDHKNALKHLRHSMSLKDSVFSEEKLKNIQELTVKYETREKEQAIKDLQTANSIEVLRRNWLLSLSGAALLLAGFLFYYWRNKHLRSRQLLAIHQQNLTQFTQTLVEKNKLIFEMENELAALRETAVSPSDQAPDVQIQEELLNHLILTESDWIAFKKYFDEVYPGFMARLRNSYTDLSSAEERLFLLIKLNLNRHEIASTLGISVESVKKGRARLRKRLQLQKETDLEDFIRNF